jgi:hypothetical protein
MTLRNVFICIRLFAGFFITLFGLTVLAKSQTSDQILLGSVLGAIGLTFFYLLWQARKQATP